MKGDSKRGVVAFTIQRNDPDLTTGALRQAELFNSYSAMGPVDWELRYYVGHSVPAELLDQLEALKARVFRRPEFAEDETAGFWRHHALLSDYDYYLFRQVDARLSERERFAIDEFVASNAEFHVMRDHPSHLAPMLPGLWGCTRNGRDRIAARLPTLPPNRFFAQVNRWLGSQHESNDFPFIDQLWLWRHVWPKLRRGALIHSELATSRFHGRYPTHRFPSERVADEFVGKRFDQHEQERAPYLSKQIENLAWIAQCHKTQHTPARPGNKVSVKLACGLGNNLFQIIAGLALAKRLSAVTGQEHPCEIIIPDPVDFSQGFSVFETLGGHLRSDQHYSREHQDFKLPNPADFPNVFPNLSWRNITAPRPQVPGDLTEIISAQYFASQRFEEIVGDAKYANDLLLNQSRVVNCHFWPTVYPFPMYYWYPEILALRDHFEPGREIVHYLQSRYGLTAQSSEALIGVHIRNDLRIPDIHRTDFVSQDWIMDCIDDAVVMAGPSAPILIVSNLVANNEASSSAHLALLAELARRHPHNTIISSTLEPYYIDFFLLRLCTHLITSCSTFSFGAGLSSSRLEKMYVPNSFSDRHFMDGTFPEFCAFLPDRTQTN